MLIWTLLLILASVHKGLVQLPLTVYLPRFSEHQRNQYQGSTLIHTILICLLFIAGAGIYYGWKSSPNESGSPAGSIPLLLALIALPYLLREYIRNTLFARLQFSASIIANFIATTTQLGIISALFFNNTLDLISALWAILISATLATLLMALQHRKQFEVVYKRILPDFLMGWKLSRWALLNVLGMIGASQAYPWIILAMLDTTMVAVFGAAVAVSSVISPLLRATTAYILPRMTHGYKDGNKENVDRMLRKSILALLIPYGLWTIIGSIYAEELLTLFYSNKYAGFGPIVIFMLFRTMIESVSTPITSALQTLEKTNLTTYALFIGSVITLTATPVAIIYNGIEGACMISVVSALTVVIYKYYMLRKIEHTQP